MQIALDSKALCYTGRIDDRDPKRPEWVFPATSLRFRFRGTRAALWVTNRNVYDQNTLGAVIDGVQMRFDLNDNGQTVLPLVSEETESEHDVLVFKRMDSCHEVILERLEISGGLPPAPERPRRRIEVYGDSVSAGEVSEAVHCIGRLDPPNNGEFSNSWYSFGWLTARNLNAEFHDIAQGGIALMDGTGWFGEPNAVGMESVWDKVHYHPYLGQPSRWDFSRWTPQAVIVALGQNDSHPVDYMPIAPDGTHARRWQAHYEQFLKALRGAYPDAHIVCCTTILEHAPEWDDSIEQVCKAMGDPKTTQYRFRRNGRGTPGHLRIPEHEEMAAELTAYLKSLHIEGWDEPWHND